MKKHAWAVLLAVALSFGGTGYAAEHGSLVFPGCLAKTTTVSAWTNRYLVKVYAVLDPNKPRESMGTGSGQLIRSASGIVRILTNAHVVGTRSMHVWVHFDGQAFAQKVRVIGVDTTVDLALLEAPNPLPVSVEPIELASEGARVGDCIFAAGYPDGVRQISAGVVNSVSSPASRGFVDLFFTHQAPIMPGSSGGALVRLTARGGFELLGVNTRVAGQSSETMQVFGNVSLAVHAHIIRQTLRLLETQTRVEHAFAGFIVMDVADINPFWYVSVLGREYPPVQPGSTVVLVMNNSPAAAQSVMVGDIIRAFQVWADGRWFALPFARAKALTEEIFFNVPPGTRVRITVERGAQTFTREFVLGTFPMPGSRP